MFLGSSATSCSCTRAVPPVPRTRVVDTDPGPCDVSLRAHRYFDDLEPVAGDPIASTARTVAVCRLLLPLAEKPGDGIGDESNVVAGQRTLYHPFVRRRDAARKTARIRGPALSIRILQAVCLGRDVSVRVVHASLSFSGFDVNRPVAFHSFVEHEEAGGSGRARAWPERHLFSSNRGSCRQPAGSRARRARPLLFGRG